MEHQFKLGQRVKLAMSDEIGIVVGQAEYLEDAPRYQVRYKAGDGCQVETWWPAGALESDTD